MQRPASEPFQPRTVLLCLIVLVIAAGMLTLPVAGAAGTLPTTAPPVAPGAIKLDRTVDANRVLQTATPTPTPRPVGLLVESTPPGATVFLDGAKKNGTTPVTLTGVAPGSHVVRVTLDGYEPVEQSVTVNPAGETMTMQQRVQFTLVAVTTRTAIVTTTTPAPAKPAAVQSAVVTEPPTPAPVVSLAPAAVSSLAAVTTPTPPAVVSQAAVPSTPVTTVPPVVAERTREPPPPRTATVTVTPVAPVAQKLPADAIAARHQPVVVKVGNDTLSYQPSLIDPWFYRMLAVGASENREKALEAILPKTILQAEKDNQKPTLTDVTPYDFYTWTDHVNVEVSEGATDTPLYIRWTTDETDVDHLFYQVSIYPFSTNATEWQNEKVAGLIGSGAVQNTLLPYKDYQHAWINVARVANHELGDEPFYDGTVWRSHPSSVPGETLHPINLGIAGVEIRTRSTNLGPVTVAMPVGFSMIDAAGPTEAQNGDPNEGGTGFCTDCALSKREGGNISHLLGARDNTYYLRVVPIHKDGTAGRPSLPVTVTVARPVQCPAPGSNMVDTTVRLPSVYIISYIPAEDRIQNPPTRWVMRQDSPPEMVSLTQNSWFKGVPFPPFYNLPKGYRFGWDAQAWYAANAEEKSWWDDVTDAIGGFFSFVFSPIITIAEGIADAWDWMVAQYENLKDSVVSFVVEKFIGPLLDVFMDCGEGSDCQKDLTKMAKAGLNAALVACGVPPNLPTSTDLMDMGTDYLIQAAADEMGVGEVYAIVPTDKQDEAREKIQGGAGDLINTFKDQAATTIDVSSFVMPDPLFSQPHPGTLNLRVSNPNAEATDAVLLHIFDDGRWYTANATPIPPLQPGQAFTVPIVLNENYGKFEGWGETGIGSAGADQEQNWAYWWWSRFHDSITNPAGYDPASFRTTFERIQFGSDGRVSQDLDNLDETSQGQPVKSLQTVVIGQNGCPGGTTDTRVVFPVGWQLTMERKAYTANSYNYGEILDIKDPATNSGYLRKE